MAKFWSKSHTLLFFFCMLVDTCSRHSLSNQLAQKKGKLPHIFPLFISLSSTAYITNSSLPLDFPSQTTKKKKQTKPDTSSKENSQTYFKFPLLENYNGFLRLVSHSLRGGSVSLFTPVYRRNPPQLLLETPSSSGNNGISLRRRNIPALLTRPKCLLCLKTEKV